MAPRWGTGDERGWALRQVAGALACAADVHVVTPQGARRHDEFDGVFTVHAMASARPASIETRRDLLIAALGESGSVPGGSGVDAAGAGALLEDDEPWEPSASIIEALRPDLVVLAGHTDVGSLRVCERVCPGVPLILVPLVTDARTLALAHFAPIFERAHAVLVFTDTEQGAVAGRYPTVPVHRVGVPLAANPSVQREPNTHLGEREYALVVTGGRGDDSSWAAALTRVLGVRFPQRHVAVSALDRLAVFHDGEIVETAAVERGTDLLRLVAWARMMVDLRPGTLFARRCVESLHYATPIVVPESSRAREHAESGAGGLWFEGPSDLTGCVEALFDSDTADALGQQGKAYAELHYGTTESFMTRLAAVVGPAMGGSLSVGRRA
ncbi:MAG: glycosyltransferase [Acidimicrobiales bacterium]